MVGLKSENGNVYGGYIIPTKPRFHVFCLVGPWGGVLD